MYSQYRGTRTSKGETPLGSFRARGSFAGRGSCPALNRCAGCDDVLHSSGLRVPVIPSTYTSTTDVGSTLELSWQRILPVTNVHRATGRACSRIDHPYSDSSRLRRCPRTSRAANVCPKAGTREAASDSLYILSLLGLTQEEGTDVLHRAFDASSTPVDKTQVEAIGGILADANVPVKHLSTLLIICPELLACSPEDLHRRVVHLKEDLGLRPRDVARLICAVPRALCLDESAANVLEVTQLLRSHGVPDVALSAAAKHCPELFAVQAANIKASIGYMEQELHYSRAQTVNALQKGLPALRLGASFFVQELQRILGDVSHAKVVGLLQKQCALFSVDIKNAQAVVKVLTDAGLTTGENRLLVEMYPNILRQRPSDVALTLAMVTRVLGHSPNSVLGSPSLIFSRTVSACLGPRFSFVRQHMPESAMRWSPSTLVRSKDRDFARIVDVPLDQYLAYKTKWQVEHKRQQEDMEEQSEGR